MRRVLLTTGEASIEAALLETAREAIGPEWHIQSRASLEQARDLLSFYSFDIWLIDGVLLDAYTSFESLLLELRALRPRMVILIWCRELDTMRMPLLSLGVDDVVPMTLEHFREPERVADLLAFFEHHHDRRTLTPEAFALVGRRGAELLGLNALVHGLSNSLDRAEIVHRALTIMCGLCRKGAVAFLEYVSEERAGEESDPLFSATGEHDVFEVMQEVGHEETETFQLRLVEQLAHDRLLVCVHPKLHPSWEALLQESNPILLRDRPEAGAFPGLDPLWHRFRQGCVFLVPVTGLEGPVGVLVIAELETISLGDMPFSQESLVAMGALLGGTLENARLFEEISQAYESVQRAQERLVHTEKFAAVGLLSAQVAHEINNPASFVISNLSVMLDYVNTIASFFDAFFELCPEPQRAGFEGLMEEFEIGFLREDLQKLLARSLSGMQRIHQIVQDLRFFAHDSGPELTWVDLEALLDASLNLIEHELKYRATIERDYSKIPNIFSDANKLSQVFLNLLVNASQALAEGDVDMDFIRVGTMLIGRNALVYIEDSGRGILPEHLSKVFEPFFTTKRRGEGTGLGLSITREILHSLGGDVRITSELGEGTRIEVILPIRDEELVVDERVLDSGSWRQPPELRRRKATPAKGSMSGATRTPEEP